MTVRIVEVIGRSVQRITLPFICRGDHGQHYFVKGNVNLLWTHRDCRLHVIDQNLAFDEGSMGGFWETHVFRESRREWTATFRDEISGAMTGAFGNLPEWWREMPEAWTEVETGLTLAGLQKLLSRFRDDPATFWEHHE